MQIFAVLDDVRILSVCASRLLNELTPGAVRVHVRVGQTGWDPRRGGTENKYRIMLLA